MPNKRVIDTTLFQVVASVGVLTFFVTMQIIYASETKVLEWDFSAKGFNYFVFELYKVPFYILSGMLVVLGFIAVDHRSYQSAEQINQSNKQIALVEENNKLTGYYKHRESVVVN